MPTPLLAAVARHAADAAGDRAAPLVIVGGAGLVALTAMATGAPSIVVLGIAALPLALAIGQNQSMGLVVALLVARALTDNSGNQLLSVGIAMAATALGALVLLGTRGVAAPVTVLLALFFASAAAGAHAHGASVTFGEAFRMMSIVAVALVAAHAPGRLSLGQITGAVQLIAVVPALVAVYQLATGTGSDIAGSIRSSGTLAHPNSAAMLFALANLVTFSRVLDRHSRRWFQLGLLALFLVAQVSTGSLGGAAAMLAMVLVYLFAPPVRQAGRIIVTAAGLTAGAILVLTSRIGTSRISEFQDPIPGKDDSLDWRLNAWGEALGAWRNHVFLGNGLGSTLAKTIVPGNIPHNEYVRILAEVGALGFVAVIAISIAVAVSIARRGRTSTDRRTSSLALAAMAGAAVNASAANTMLYSASFYATVLVVGGCWRILRDTQITDLVPHVATPQVSGRQAPGRAQTSTVGVLTTTTGRDI